MFYTKKDIIKYRLIYVNIIHEMTFRQFYEDYNDLIKQHFRPRNRAQRKKERLNIKQLMQELHLEQVCKMLDQGEGIPRAVLLEYQYKPKTFQKVRAYIRKKGILLD